MTAPLVEVAGLRKSFGSEGVLDGIDLDVRENEVLVLMGPNGSGKSVLLACIAGGKSPSAGSVTVRGAAGQEESPFSLLLQDAMGVGTLSGRENVEFYADLDPRMTDRWRDLVEDFDVAGDLDRRFEDYSGGMRRKVELAIALSIDAPIYLLDEPTAALDLSVVQQAHAAIHDLTADGRTVVMASHLPSDAGIADRIAFLRDGTILDTGRPDDLLEAMPTVVQSDAAVADADLESHVLDGRLFDEGGSVRGFLRSDADPSALPDASVVEPTHADLFNYYVHVAPEL